MKNIAKSLSKFHELMGNVAKDADNPFFRSKYAPLDSILPAIKGPLKEAGLVFTQVPIGICKLKTTIIDVESGEFIEGEFEMTPAKNDPQGQAATITYMRRYALTAMLGLNCDEDDDGNTASAAAKVKTKKETPPTLTSLQARKNAEEAIGLVANLDALMAVEKNIEKSKILTPKDKEELGFMADERRQDFDPTQD